MPKALDPFWEYGSPDGGTNRACITCKLCGTRMTGGITRLKYHLARLSGHDVGVCTVSSPEVIQKALEAIDENDKKKEEAKRNKVERTGRSFGISSPNFGVEGSGPSGRGSTIGTPSHGYKSATYEELRGPILQAEKQDINSRLAELKKTWEVTGCTMMFDGWIDRKGRSLLNFLVHCPKGTMFIKFLDALEHIKDATTICELLDGFIREIGVQNVVQVITDNAANYVSAGRMLMERHPTLFWTPCVAHCLNLLLEDMGKLSFIKEAVDMAREHPQVYL
eukprot:PITA_07353